MRCEDLFFLGMPRKRNGTPCGIGEDGAMSLQVKSLSMNENDSTGGKWGQNIALFLIVAVLVVLFAIWMCNKTGQDKADLAASVQGVVSRVNAIEPAVTANGQSISRLNNSVGKVQQSIQFIGDDVAALDDAVYVPRCGHGRSGCGCGDDKFRKETTYTLGTTTLTEIDTCNN